MIVGAINRYGHHTVEGILEIPRLGVSYAVPFLVDTGAYGTRLHPRDGLRAGLPFDRLRSGVTVGGIGGESTYYQEPATLVFADDTEQRDYRCHITVAIAKPEAVSG